MSHGPSQRSAVDRLLVALRPNPRAQIRLVCVPYAGGAASVFRGWAAGLPAEVEVRAVQLPGREDRFREPRFTRMEPVIKGLAGALGSSPSVPYALFGHSLGALVAFELARELSRRGAPGPAHLFVSAHVAPHLHHTVAPLHRLPDPEFLDELSRRYQGIPDVVRRDAELMDLFLPLLRADWEILGTYVYAEGPPLCCPITAFGGREDREVDREALGAWDRQTTGPFRLEMVPGGHLFLRGDAQPQLLATLTSDLARSARARSSEFPWH